MDKKELRLEVKRIAEGLDEEYVKVSSAMVLDKLLHDQDFIDAKCIFIYLNMDKEVDTKGIIRAAWEMGKKVVVPKCIGKHEMIACEVHGYSDLVPAAFGIYEPKDAIEVDKDEIDLGIIPSVCASKDMKRLGHGRGYYDIFLKDARMKKIAITFEKLLRDDIEMDTYDVYMDKVISELAVYEQN